MMMFKKKTQALLAGMLLAMGAAAALASGDDDAHDHKPQHGGVVVEVSEGDFELVAKPDLISLYLRGHQGQPVNLQGGSAKLTLLSAGNEKSEIQLIPAGDRLQAKGSFKLGAGSKAVAMVTLAGKKPVNVRFLLK